MKQIKIENGEVRNGYTFDELPKDVKQKALEQWVEDEDYIWGSDALKSLKKFAEHFNSELNNYDIDFNEPYRSSVYFSVPDYVKDWSEKELREAIMAMGSYDKKTLRGNGDCVFTGVDSDENAADGARKAFFSGEREVKEILMAGFKTWMDACHEDYKNQCSEAYYSEHCEANDYLFDADGEILPITYHTNKNKVERITFGKAKLNCTIS